MGSMYHMPTPPNASADGLVDSKSLLPVPTSSAGRTSATEAPGAGAGGAGASVLSTRGSPMERGTTADYAQTGLPSPYSGYHGDTRSEGSPADQQSAAAQFPTHTEVRPSNYSASATPTSEVYYPQSARSGSFPEHIHRQYHPATSSASSAGMAQQANSPSLPQQDGRNHQSPQLTADRQLPLDPSIAGPSPTYAYGQAQSPYSAGEMTPNYSYPQQRPDWASYAQHSAGPLTPSGHHVFSQQPQSAPPQHRPNQVYSFVPIPGAQQHKRPRRRYEEIERMYKCGWNGCEKAYGTLNHLNAHVTMQSHGQKRTPEEFKEIRKEWKQRKKEEEAQRKAEEDRQRAAAAAAVQNGPPEHGPDGGHQSTGYGGRQQLPPIAYGQAAAYPPGPPSAPMPQLSSDYPNSQVYPSYPYSPHGQPGQGMYNQPPASGPPQNH